MRTPLLSKHDSQCGMFRTVEPVSYGNNQIKCLICVVNNRYPNRSVCASLSKTYFKTSVNPFRAFSAFLDHSKHFKGSHKKVSRSIKSALNIEGNSNLNTERFFSKRFLRRVSCFLKNSCMSQAQKQKLHKSISLGSLSNVATPWSVSYTHLTLPTIYSV